MKSVKELKESVAQRMKRCWGESCALFFISAGGIAAALFAGYLVMNFLVATGRADGVNDPLVLAVAAVIFLVMWIITVPYKYGLRWYRLQQARGHSVHAKSVFSCYFSTKRMIQVYKLSLALSLRKCMLLIPFAAFFAAGVFLIITLASKGDNLGSNIAVVILLMITVVAYIAYNVINIKYTAAPYIFAIGHDRTTNEIIRESVQFMKGSQAYMIDVLRNCALMLIPCMLIFPMIFEIPKMMMVYTAAINEVMEKGYAEDKLVSMERRG